MKTKSVSRDITRTTLAVLFIGILIAACFWILSALPDFAIIWAAIIVVATWPVLLKVSGCAVGQTRTCGYSDDSCALDGHCCALIHWLLLAVVDKADEISSWIKTAVRRFQLPPPPEWVSKIPLGGGSLLNGGSSTQPSGRRNWFGQTAPLFAAGCIRLVYGQSRESWLP